ncbi:unnamed protein product [Pleuronectes platessa]|uniref:Uncharacterized protein n=1 Tax=Pleuronectes platessa TaxID=8262 RepID=A0A9N7V645_PLEPL|nr:unnamed protein product [Pleuronectes platessa]
MTSVLDAQLRVVALLRNMEVHVNPRQTPLPPRPLLGGSIQPQDAYKKHLSNHRGVGGVAQHRPHVAQMLDTEADSNASLKSAD